MLDNVIIKMVNIVESDVDDKSQYASDVEFADKQD
jgi:hypothetical protein